MTALSAPTGRPERLGRDFVHPVGAGAKIWQGGLVVLNATGFAIPGHTALGLTAVGRADADADNTAGADGAITVPVRKGVFRFASLGADPVGRTLIGEVCYLVDDNTVAATSGGNTRSAAGIVVDVDAIGAWVEI